MSIAAMAFAFVLVAAFGLYGWSHYKRITNARTAQAKDLAAKRARYARQSARAEPEPELFRQKPGFGRR